MYALYALGLRLLLGVAAALLAPGGAAAWEPHWPQTISIGTASAGGTYFVYGEALARILTRENDADRPRAPARENIKLIESEIDLGFVTRAWRRGLERFG